MGGNLERVKILRFGYFFSQVPKSLYFPTFVITFLISSRCKFEQILTPRNGKGPSQAKGQCLQWKIGKKKKHHLHNSSEEQKTISCGNIIEKKVLYQIIAFKTMS